jgi:hypothetical protein
MTARSWIVVGILAVAAALAIYTAVHLLLVLVVLWN